MTTTAPSSEAGSFNSQAPEATEAGAWPAASRQLKPLMKFTGLTQEVQKHGPVRPLQSHLHGLTQAEMALAVVDLLNLHHQHGEVLGVVVSHIWDYYIVPEKLWEHYEGGKTQFMEDICYREFVGPALESAKVSMNRKMRNIASLEAVWGEGWEKRIDAETDHPSVLSEHYLRNMAKLASSGITLSNAQQVLNHVMLARIAHPGKGVRTKRSIIATDIQKVITAVESVRRTLDIEPKECSATSFISTLVATASTSIRTTGPVTGEIAGPPAPPAVLPSSVASTFSVEIVARHPSPPAISSTPLHGTAPPNGLPSPEPTPFSKHLRAPSNNNQLSQTTDYIPSLTQSPVHSCRQSSALPDTGDTQSDTRSPSPSTGRSTQPVYSLSHPLPVLETSEVGTNICDVGPDELQPLAALHTTLEPPVSSTDFVSSTNLLRPPSLSREKTESASAPLSRDHQQRCAPRPRSAPERHSGSRRRPGSQVQTSAWDSSLQSPPPSSPPTVIAQPLPLPASKKRPYSDYISGDNTLPIRDPTPTFDSRLQSPSPSAAPAIVAQPLVQPPAPERPYIPGINIVPSSHIFSLPDNWADDSSVHASMQKYGFYKCADVRQLADPAGNIAIHTQLTVFDRIAKLSDNTNSTYGFHTLLQQTLVQHPRVYLTALATMKTTNYRLISLPVPLIDYSSDGSDFIHSTFPFEKYISCEKEVPGIRLLYPLNDSTLQIGTSLSTHKSVESWWGMCGGDLAIAARQICPEEGLAVSLQAGELIAMLPQLVLTAEVDSPHNDSSEDGSSCTSPVPAKIAPAKIAEVRYISLTPDQMLDFDYWPMGSYDQISQWNRDLLAPTVTGWGGKASPGWQRSKAVIEMRGLWAIGDALLGLMRWDSTLVQVELGKLFDASAGSWFNTEFASEIEGRFNRKLASMVDTLEEVHNLAFSTAG